jgi:hypothetical protein
MVKLFESTIKDRNGQQAKMVDTLEPKGIRNE